MSKEQFFPFCWFTVVNQLFKKINSLTYCGMFHWCNIHSWMSDEEIVCMFELIVGFFFIFSSAQKLDKGEFMFFLTGGATLQNEIPNPDPSWLTKTMWDKICHLDSQPAFSGEIDKCAYVENLWGNVTDNCW